MPVTYSQFRELVRTADGPFGYLFFGMQMVCDPIIYVAVQFGGDWSRV
jgi:hypothetical protein